MWQITDGATSFWNRSSERRAETSFKVVQKKGWVNANEDISVQQIRKHASKIYQKLLSVKCELDIFIFWIHPTWGCDYAYN